MVFAKRFAGYQGNQPQHGNHRNQPQHGNHCNQPNHGNHCNQPNHRNEVGIVESALVIIPLLMLFFISLDLIVAVNYRNIDLAFAQSQASSSALNSVISDQDEILTFKLSRSDRDLRIVLSHRARSLPNFLSAFSLFGDASNRKTDVTGLAVMESQR
jgi:hypothetical protein